MRIFLVNVWVDDVPSIWTPIMWIYAYIDRRKKMKMGKKKRKGKTEEEEEVERKRKRGEEGRERRGLEHADIIAYALFLVLGNAFRNPGDVSDFLGGER